MFKKTLKITLHVCGVEFQASFMYIFVSIMILCILGIWSGILRGITFIGIITNVSTCDI